MKKTLEKEILNGLQQMLETVSKQSFVIFSYASTPPRTLQAVRTGDTDDFWIEVIGNEFLDRAHWLSETEIAGLHRLGWTESGSGCYGRDYPCTGVQQASKDTLQIVTTLFDITESTPRTVEHHEDQRSAPDLASLGWLFGILAVGALTALASWVYGNA